MLLISQDAMRRLNRSRGLGATATPPSNAAIAAICPSGITAGNCGCTVDTANVQSLFSTAATTRMFPWPLPDPAWADCTNQNAASTAQEGNIIGTAGKSAGTAITTGAIAAGAAAGSAVPIIGTIIGAITGLFASIFGAHAQAVKAQNTALCQAIPQINAQLQQIDAGLAGGSITPAQAQQAYSLLQSQFQTAMQSGTSYKKCDALYACNLAMQILIWQRNQDLQNGVLTNGQPIPGTAGAAPTVASAVAGAASSLASTIESALGITPSADGTTDWTPWLVIGGALAAALLL